MSENHANDGATHGVRHWLGFLGSGTLAFMVDLAVLKFLTVVASMPVLPARLISISVAMVAGWLCHRTFTFAIAARPTVAEFVKYLGVAWTASALNYAVFAIVLIVWPSTSTVIALIAAGVFAMVASYLGMRFAAFKRPRV